MIWTITLALLAGYPVWALGIAGDWQGTIGEGRKFRVVLKIAADANGNLGANLYSIDQSSAAIPVQALTVNASVVTFGVPRIRGSYKGTLSADGTAITGIWTQPNGDHVLSFVRAARDTAWALDQAPHTRSFVNVDAGVKLEVLDWGGTGRPLVLLAGLGDNAHVFDQFAAKLKAKYHVYAITRRGFGASDSPVPTETNYSANRLGDDVIAVLDVLKLIHPVLVGHSIAGEELSSIGTRYPERVAGLVYLDAGYQYAAYDKAQPDFGMDLLELKRKLSATRDAISPQEERTLLTEIAADLPAFENDVKTRLKEIAGMPAMTPEAISEAKNQRMSSEGISARAVQDGKQPFRDVKCPALAIFAVPHQRGDKQDADADARDIARVEPLVKAFEKGVPQARVVRMPHANHYVFSSNEADVIREIDEFVSSLK
ncbi:MAG TPA: alpha/beta hydrolase [Bryobacteraceae bacterium]|nr:alpha/beta hydrolase [Bryobacteraceae bacterium]